LKLVLTNLVCIKLVGDQRLRRKAVARSDR